MNELSIINTITEVVKVSKDIYQEFSVNHTVSRYRKQELREALDAYILIKKGENAARIFNSNIQILEKCWYTIENIPEYTPLYGETIRQFNTLSDCLEKLLAGYGAKQI